MFITFSPRFIFISLIVINSMFLAAGVSMLAYGIYRQVVSGGSPDKMEEAGSAVAMIITAGILDIGVGVCGLVGVLLKKRMLLLVNAGVLASVALVNLIFCIAFPISGYGMIGEASSNVKSNFILLYGNLTDDRGRSFTESFDEHQDIDKCCGWSSDDGDNIYLKTPWYTQMNQNQKGAPRTLPDSCCQQRAAERIHQCQVASNLLEARKAGIVFKMDCMTKMAGRIKVYIWLATSQLLISTILQFLVIGYLILIYLQPTSE